MHLQKRAEKEMSVNINDFKHLKFEKINNVYIASLNDLSDYTVAKGYGNTVVEAVNDLHRNII